MISTFDHYDLQRLVLREDTPELHMCEISHRISHWHLAKITARVRDLTAHPWYASSVVRPATGTLRPQCLPEISSNFLTFPGTPVPTSIHPESQGVGAVNPAQGFTIRPEASRELKTWIWGRTNLC